jgi:hypothetical protein
MTGSMRQRDQCAEHLACGDSHVEIAASIPGDLEGRLSRMGAAIQERGTFSNAVENRL